VSFTFLTYRLHKIYNFFRTDAVTAPKTHPHRPAATLNFKQRNNGKDKERIQIWTIRMKQWYMILEKIMINVRFPILFHSMIWLIQLRFRDRTNENDDLNQNFLSELLGTSRNFFSFNHFLEYNLLQNVILFYSLLLFFRLLLHLRYITFTWI
jgi:hypothetical protein